MKSLYNKSYLNLSDNKMAKLNKLESLLHSIINSACEKIIASASLLKTGYSLNLSLFTAILAQEELSKLIILPIIREIGDVSSIINHTNKLYFNHGIKHKVFTGYGLQNRTYNEIEKIKQSSLYVGIDSHLNSNWKNVTTKEAEKELNYAINLLANFLCKAILATELSNDFRKVIGKIFHNHTILLKKIAPASGGFEVAETVSLLDNHIKCINKEIETNKDHTKMILTDPFSIISLFKFYFPKNYKKHLKNIITLNYEEMKTYCEKHMDINAV